MLPRSPHKLPPPASPPLFRPSSAWSKTAADGGLKIPKLVTLLGEYQDPTAVDKIAKAEVALVETKEVLSKTIDAVLARGEKLEDLVASSEKLSSTSKMFYKTAAKTNSCCSIA